jgi:hypothetical protein
MKHTAGKWIDDGDDIGVEIDVAGDTVFLTICHIENPGLYTTTDSIAEEAANKAIIMAAPELLEACKWLLFHAENGRRWKTVAHRGLDFTDDEFEGRLRSVIAKAEGRG